MSYDENKQPLGLDELTELQDGDVFIVQRQGQVVKKVRRDNTGLSKSFQTSFIIDDWEIDGDEYILNVNHDLGGYGIIEVYHNDQIVRVQIERVDDNIIKLLVPTNPDLRFDGRVIITK